MMRVALIGKNSNRCPLAYPAYRDLLADEVEVVDRPEDADILMFGYVANLEQNAQTVIGLLEADPAKKLVVLSEEPLWDTTHDNNHSGYFWDRHNLCRIGKHDLPFTLINHQTSDAFAFDRFPYFLTTDDEYFLRYSMYFDRNARRDGWKMEDFDGREFYAAFFAERRTLERKYDVNFPSVGVRGLSIYRTQIAEGFSGRRHLRVGAGWSDKPRRQDLPDWHLEKLAVLRGRAFIVSAIENTCQKYYVTEKLFDAFACCAVPVYWAPPGSWIDRIVPSGSYLNLYGRSVEEAKDDIARFRPDPTFLDAYGAAQQQLAEMFRYHDDFLFERKKFARKFLAELLDATTPLERPDATKSSHATVSV